MSEFADPNLKLIVLQAAWNEGLLPPFDKPAFFRDVLKEEYDEHADYNYKLDERVREHLLAIPLPSEQLSRITTIEWDGGNEIFLEIWSYWDGESDEFDIHDLTGINKLTGLETAFFNAGVAFRDVTPIAGMLRLEKFLNYSTPIDDLTPFLSLPKLTRLQAMYPDTPSNRAAIVELQKRGVTVTSKG